MLRRFEQADHRQSEQRRQGARGQPGAEDQQRIGRRPRLAPRHVSGQDEQRYDEQQRRPGRCEPAGDVRLAQGDGDGQLAAAADDRVFERFADDPCFAQRDGREGRPSTSVTRSPGRIGHSSITSTTTPSGCQLPHGHRPPCSPLARPPTERRRPRRPRAWPPTRSAEPTAWTWPQARSSPPSARLVAFQMTTFTMRPYTSPGIQAS